MNLEMGFFTEAKVKGIVSTAIVLLVVLYIVSNYTGTSTTDMFGLTSHKTEG